MRVAVGVIGVVLIAGAALASPSRVEVERVVAGIEHAPSAEDVKRLGAGADQALVAYARDPKVTRLRRLRAIAALRYAPSTVARDFLHAVLAEQGKALEGVDALDAAAALGALTPYGRGELAIVVSYLEHGAADVRAAAAHALAQLHEADAVGALTARFSVERDAAVRAAIGHAIVELRRR